MYLNKKEGEEEERPSKIIFHLQVFFNPGGDSKVMFLRLVWLLNRAALWGIWAFSQ